MPWHDLSIVMYGEAAKDLARHFIEYWNHAKIDLKGTKNKQEGYFLKPTASFKKMLGKAKEKVRRKRRGTRRSTRGMSFIVGDSSSSDSDIFSDGDPDDEGEDKTSSSVP